MIYSRDETMNGFIRACGGALVVAGALVAVINGVIFPLMPARTPAVLVEVSGMFLLRQSASAVAVLLLLFGCLGIHLVQRNASGLFGAMAFVAAFVGGCLVFAVEWTDVFVLRTVARASPDVFHAIDRNSFMTAGFASAAGLFAVGWMLFAISAWRAAVLPRWSAMSTLAGLLLIPLLQASPLKTAGAVIGNLIFAVGLVGLGRAVAARPAALPGRAP